jgi:hypothetical protein
MGDPINSFVETQLGAQPMNPFFDWLKDTGTQAVLTLMATVAACIAAIAAIYYGRKSLTGEDLEPLEEHTAATSRHLQRQREAEELNIRASMVSISVTGRDRNSDPFTIHLTIKDTTITLTRVELYNEAQNLFGGFPCERTSELEYAASVDSRTASNWFHAGTPFQSATQVRLRLRIFMLLAGTEVSRQMAITLNQIAIANPQGQELGWMITGSV